MITSKMKKRELIVFLICFAAAYVMNVLGVILYKNPAKELITQLHIVILLAVIFYAAVVILRVLYYLVSRLWLFKK